MRALLTSVPLLAIGLAILSALTGMLLVPADTFGSCFEGGCGYIGLFVVTPLATLVILPLSWLLVKQLGDLSKIILWFPVVMLLGTLLWGHWFGLVIAPVLLVAVAVTTIRQHRAINAPLRGLFLKTGTTAPQEPK